ncbi:DUF6966 domain-containing protein [Enterobacter cloacae complex sp. 2024EL-00215]|jgi:hypothetical protein|uniref:DUF6966 domain-containing protein n=1 Tax=unclassified Enterobacter cloacae complex TaxID=2757714 RepID=UPI0037506C66
MNNDEEIKNVISKLHLLLHNCGNESWATKLAYIHGMINDDPDQARYLIMTSFGGMGSLNDIVLSLNDQMLVEENRELDSLRKRLFELAQRL